MLRNRKRVLLPKIVIAAALAAFVTVAEAKDDSDVSYDGLVRVEDSKVD